MTLENCRKLLKHYEDTEQSERAEEMAARIAKKEASQPEVKKEPKSKKEK